MSVESQAGLRSGVGDGIEWKLLLSPLGISVNGYARIPAGHPWHGLDYDDVPADVHGGLTFSDDGWIGFDTAHAFDWWTAEELARVGGARPLFWYRPGPDRFDIVWTIEKVIAETENLARQVAEAARTVQA